MAETKTNPDKLFLLNIPYFIDYVMNPRFLIIMASLIAVGSIIFISPIAGVILNLVITAITFKFAVDILLSTAEGSFDPDDVSFSDNGYAIVVQIVVIAIILSYLGDLAESSRNPLFINLMYYGVPIIMPAIYMVLSYTGSVLEALNPLTLVKFISPWIVTYGIYLVFYMFTTYLQARGIESVISHFVSSYKVIYIVSVFLLIFFTFLNFHIMGFLMYQNFGDRVDDYDDGDEDDTSSSGGSAKRKGNKSPSFDNPIYNRIQDLLKTGGTDEALAIIKELQRDGDNSQELSKFKQLAMVAAENKKEAPIAEQIHTLIQENKIGTAFQLLQDIYAKQEAYHEAEERDVTLLAKHAFNLGKFPIVIKLLNGFNKNYPNSQDVVPNYYLVAQVLYKNPKTQAKALAILKGLMKKYPNHGMMTEIKSWAKGVELMQNKKPNNLL